MGCSGACIHQNDHTWPYQHSHPAAAIFGRISVRICRLPITIGTMLLTVISSLILIILSRAFPSLHAGAMNVAGRIKFEDFILHGILGLLLFAGAFLLDLRILSHEKLTVGLLSVIGTLLSTAAMAFVMGTGRSL